MDVFEYGSKHASVVLLQPVDDHDLDAIEDEITVIHENYAEEFQLIAFKVNAWHKDLSPWKAPAVFGKEAFGDGAADTLHSILKFCEDRTKKYYIGGYSLAGLFALWTAYQVESFRGVAAASPSIWFPDFFDYMKDNKLKSRNIYLSLGDKEEKARNPIMATVGETIRAAYAMLKDQNVNCTLEWNEGNHFKDAGLRTAKAFLWVMKQ